MILSGYVRCSTCNRNNYKNIVVKTPTPLKIGEVREFKWSCDKCGMLNFIKIEAINE